MNTLTDAQLLVSPDVAALLDRATETGDDSSLSEDQREAITLLADNGFLVSDRESERRALDQYFEDIRHDSSHLHLTVLTTLQCNFACDYCIQGDHGDHNAIAQKMSLKTSGHVVAWIERELDRVRPERFSITFFGGEPLLNLPVVYELAERAWSATKARGIKMTVSVITNGLLLTPEVVDRLKQYGLSGVKVTLDGDRDTHNRMRPLRGGQGTFDRIIDNIRQVAGRVPITIGGNFDAGSADRYPVLLDFLKEQEFAGKLAKISFKPIIRREPPSPKGVLPLVPVGADGKPLPGTCSASAGAGGSICDTCNFNDEKEAFLREETRRRGFPTADGVHMGPCQIHREHAHTIGPDGSLYACPGFASEPIQATGHIDGRGKPGGQVHRRFEEVGAWKNCGDCAFIPVCAGGCSVASHTELGDMNTPACHKSSFESALIALAHDAASAA